MKKYTTPELVVSKFEATDIVTVSVVTTEINFTSDTHGDLVYTSDYTNG